MSELFTDELIIPAESADADLFTDSADVLPENVPDIIPEEIPVPAPSDQQDFTIIEPSEVSQEVELLEEIVTLLSGDGEKSGTEEILETDETVSGDDTGELQEVTEEEEIEEYTIEDIYELVVSMKDTQQQLLIQQADTLKITNGILITILFALSLVAGLFLARIVWRKL